MTITNVELIDILRNEASRLEKNGTAAQPGFEITEIVEGLKKSGIQPSGLEQLESLTKTGFVAPSTGIADYFRRWADALEKQLLAMLDLPVDISLLRNAA